MRIALGTKFQRQPFAEFKNGNWRIWIMYNPDVTSGTFILLSKDGTSAQMITTLDGEIQRIVELI